MLTDLLILIISGLASTLLGLLIVLRNPTQANNRRFAYLSLAFVIWSTSNYLSDHINGHYRLFARLTFFGGVLAIYTVINFIAKFPNSDAFKKNFYLRLHTTFTIVLMPIIFTSEFVRSLTIKVSGSVIHTGYLYNLYIFYVVYSFVLLFVVIRRQNSRANTVSQKQQVKIISWGIAAYSVLAVGSNVLLPILINNWSSSRFGPAFALLLVTTVAYAIIKHKLFDIRLIVARSLAYTLTLITVGSLYGFITFGVIARVFFKTQHFVITQQIVFSMLAIILVFTFPKIQKFFDKVTNSLFYRDAYDTQTFLNQFNKVLVSTYELNKLLKEGSKVIEENLKSTFCLFEIRETGLTAFRMLGTGGTSLINKDDNKQIKVILPKMKHRIITADSLKEGNDQLKSVMLKNNIEVIAKLVIGSSDKDTGYIILGPKKSGNLYSTQDLNIIEIIANELVIAVQNALRFEEIQNFNLTLQDKVDEATRKLRRANEKLKALDESKDDFISMASHQLRTPLTSIKGYISMVLEGDAGKVSPMQHEMLGQAFFSSQRMVYLISDLLNVSRLKTGKFIIERAKVNLATMVAQELDQLKETASARQLTLTHEAPDNFPDLMLDETKTRQVIMNFVDNAIYYTPAGGHINVKLIDNPTSIELRVIDDGIGVSKADQHLLFTKFYRAGNARKARPDGTGLGLFMAKKVIIAEEGNLIFESTEGKGSTFGFVFYKSKAGVTE